MKSGEHAIWDAAVYVWQRDHLLRQLRGLSADALRAIEEPIVEATRQAAAAFRAGFGVLLSRPNVHSVLKDYS